MKIFYKPKKIFWLPLVLRLTVYFIAIAAPFFSSTILVRYDIPGFAFWFIFIPLQIIISYNFVKGLFPETSSPAETSARMSSWIRLGRKIAVSRNLFFPALVFLLPILFSVFPGFYALLPTAYVFTIIIFIFNILVFRTGVVALIFIEPAFIYFIFYKLLDFSRASDSVWQNSSYILPVFYILLITLYLFLSIILYGSSGNKKLLEFKKEIIIFFAIIIPLVVIAAIFIPADHIVNDFIFNFRDEKVFPKGMSGDEDESGKGSDPKDKGKLSGIPADRWGGRSRTSASGESKQYAVMVVSSDRDELYSAWEYLGGFHPVKGFTYIYNEYTDDGIDERNLNMLKKQRFLEAWKNPYAIPDEDREEVKAFFLSTLPERVVPYLPVMIEPTIYSTQRYPFSYSYNSVSMISPLTLEFLEDTELYDFSEEELDMMSQYLEMSVSDKYKKIFDAYLESAGAVIPAGGYIDDPEIFKKNIIAIIQGFYGHQYEIGYDEDVSVEKISRFLLKEFPGDCTEFSNAAAMVARRAGIPSRVVTGYLASKGLQTPQHIQALAVLQGSIDIIADIPLEELILVTTAHRHSWVQFYIPSMGWVDFDATTFAIPPMNGDMNSAKIVIPIIRQLKDKSPNFVFPWKFILSVFGMILILIITLLYLYKFIIMTTLCVKSLKPTDVSFESRYKYILHRFFLLGYPLKTKTVTPVEYGALNNEALLFTELFTELLYRDVYTDDERYRVIKKFEEEYFRLKELTKPKGFLKRIKNIFSLRGVFY